MMKINIFWGELTNISASKEALDCRPGQDINQNLMSANVCAHV